MSLNTKLTGQGLPLTACTVLVFPCSLGKRIKAALLCKALPKGDNPAEYVNGPDNAPSRNLVTAMKLSGYVIHSGTGGKVSAVDGDGRKVSTICLHSALILYSRYSLLLKHHYIG